VNLFYQPLIPNGVRYLDEEESRHCVKVLRKNQGDSIRLTDGKGLFYDAIIRKADSKQCTFDITSDQESPKRNFSIHLAISPTKNADRLEWFVEKATEFGIDKITPIHCQHTERTYFKADRLEKVAVSAMKQSLKATLPVIQALTDFQALIKSSSEEQRFIAFVDSNNPNHLLRLASPHASYLVVIGPEGDFSSEELGLALNAGFIKVSLGDSRLRTETAGIAACHILNLVNS
jgi:16S rRNA (uracil1498-N3)-methyltransferase